MKHLNAVFNLLIFSLLLVAGTTLFASNSPVISISPTTYDVNERSGAVTVNLNINIDTAPDTAAINITYETVSGTASAPDNYVSISSNVTFDANGSIAPKNISITVNSDFVISDNISFTVALSDNDTNASQLFTISPNQSTINIININRVPEAYGKTYRIDVNSILTGNIITDAHPSEDLDGDTITVSDHNSTFTINSDGSFTYSPATDSAQDFCGIYSFDYNITDGIEISNTATVTIDVRNILQNPVNDSYLINRVDQTLYGNVLTNDPNQDYTVTGFSTPSHGTVTLLDGNGSFEYTPDGSFTGDVFFDYNVSDGTTCSTATATVTVTITDMCNNVIPLTLCGDPVTPTIETNDPQAYSFTIPNAILDLNLTNTGKKLLLYDFREGDCDSLFAGETTSELPQGESIDILKEYPAATYYIGLSVGLGTGNNKTDIELSVCFDTNLSGGGGLFFSHIGINEPSTDFAIDESITTKVVNQSFNIRASYLDGNGSTAPYDGSYDKNGEVGMPVILSMAENSCEKLPDSIVTTLILDHGDWHKETSVTPDNNSITIPYAAKIRQLYITSFDFGNLFRHATGLNCGNSSLNSSLCLLPACFNTSDNIKAVFPPAFYPNVLICVNGDGGGLSPCDSQAYMGGCGGKKGGTISPSIYDNDLGCASCLQDAMETNVCSDTFAIRPDYFDIKIPDPHFPNLLRAGQEYGVSLTALDANTTPAPADQYTITGHNFNNDLEINSTKYFKDGTEDTANLLHGTPDLNDSMIAYMVNGFSSVLTSGPATNGVAEEAIKASYDDVGKVELHIYDYRWAEIDNKDTPMDCNSTAHTYICGDKNVTFIPHHFAFAELNITNHADPASSDFTYIADNRGMPITTPLPTRSPMAARVQTRIEALTKDDTITQNFRADDSSYPYDDSTLYYENNVSVAFVVTVPSTGTNSYLYPDANESNTTTVADPNLYNAIGFGRTGLDDNGTRNILWNESNFPLDFNFRRDINETANPFDVNGSYLKSIKIVSHYVDSDDGDMADINGSRLGDWNNETAITACDADDGCEQRNADNNATFYYGITQASRSYYPNITTDSTLTPIFVYIYCAYEDSECSDYKINTEDGETSDSEWWLSWDHNTSRQDGNITLRIGAVTEGAGTPSISPENVQITSEGVDPTVTVTANATELPMTVEIELVRESDPSAPDPYTNEWLIYNKNAPTAPSPFYRVMFIGGGGGGSTYGWAGYGKTGHVVENNASRKSTERVGW